MKIIKKILITISVLIVVSIAGLYLYFNQKFSPEANYLTVQNESGKVPMIWTDQSKTALLLPVQFQNNSKIYFMQLDTGSPSTLFYSNSLQKIKGISIENNRVKTQIKIGKSLISSDKFQVIQTSSKSIEDSIQIIGTIGSDILENRLTYLNFKENYVELNLKNQPKLDSKNTFEYFFKKRKLIIPATLKEKKEQFIYDSGTSAYELLTNKEVWNSLKLPNSPVTIEKENSWGNVLTTYTTQTKENIRFNSMQIPLMEITYVEGYSKTQYALMKFSKMTGMLGNKIFFNQKIFIDGKDLKMNISN